MSDRFFRYAAALNISLTQLFSHAASARRNLWTLPHWAPFRPSLRFARMSAAVKAACLSHRRPIPTAGLCGAHLPLQVDRPDRSVLRINEQSHVVAMAGHGDIGEVFVHGA